MSEHLEEFEPLRFLEDAARDLFDKNLSGIISTDDYPGSILGSILAQEFHFLGPRPEVVIACQHKYRSRILQRQVVPDSTPLFSLIGPEASGFVDGEIELPFPFFIKPVKSFFSILARTVSCEEDVLDSLNRARNHWEVFVPPLAKLTKQYGDFSMRADCFIAEEILVGSQVTVEGYVENGCATILGVVDSVMFPGTFCFQRFEYPSRLSELVQERMGDTAARLMKEIGFNNSLFNIEMMYDSSRDKISIIEINPRMSSQFADLYEKVDGVNSYEIQLKLALGTPVSYSRRNGKYAVAASFVLRTFADQRITRVPGNKEIKIVEERFPDARIELFGAPGDMLSDLFQDGVSYRYGVINLGGMNWGELTTFFKECEKTLTFTFEG